MTRTRCVFPAIEAMLGMTGITLLIATFGVRGWGGETGERMSQWELLLLLVPLVYAAYAVNLVRDRRICRRFNTAFPKQELAAYVGFTGAICIAILTLVAVVA